MALAFVNAALVSLSGDPASGSYNAGVGSNRYSVFFVLGDVNVDNVTSGTYNGAALTLIDKGNAGGDRFWYAFGLANPASGANTLAFVDSGNVPLRAHGITLSGARQTAQPDAFGKNAATSATSNAKAVTVVAANSWLVGGTFTTSTTYTAQAGTTIRVIEPDPAPSNDAIFDSNGPLAAGSQSLGVNFDATEADSILIVVSIAPEEATTTSTSSSTSTTTTSTSTSTTTTSTSSSTSSSTTTTSTSTTSTSTSTTKTTTSTSTSTTTTSTSTTTTSTSTTVSTTTSTSTTTTFPYKFEVDISLASGADGAGFYVDDGTKYD